MSQAYHTITNFLGIAKINFTAESEPWNQPPFGLQIAATQELVRALPEHLLKQIQNLEFKYLLAESSLVLTQLNGQPPIYPSLFDSLLSITEKIDSDQRGTYCLIREPGVLTIRQVIHTLGQKNSLEYQLCLIEDFKQQRQRITDLRSRNAELFTQFSDIRRQINVSLPHLLVEPISTFMCGERGKVSLGSYLNDSLIIEFLRQEFKLTNNYNLTDLIAKIKSLQQKYESTQRVHNSIDVTFMADHDPNSEQQYHDEHQAIYQLIEELPGTVRKKIQQLQFKYSFAEHCLHLSKYNDGISDHFGLFRKMLTHEFQVIGEQGFISCCYDDALSMHLMLPLTIFKSQCQELINLQAYNKLMTLKTNTLVRSRQLYQQLKALDPRIQFIMPYIKIVDEDKIFLCVGDGQASLISNTNDQLINYLLRRTFTIVGTSDLSQTIRYLTLPPIEFKATVEDDNLVTQKTIVKTLLQELPETAFKQITSLSYEYMYSQLKLMMFNGISVYTSSLLSILLPPRGECRDGWCYVTQADDMLKIRHLTKPPNNNQSLAEELQELRDYNQMQTRIQEFLPRNRQLYSQLIDIQTQIDLIPPVILFEGEHIYLRGQESKIVMPTNRSNEEYLKLFLQKEFEIAGPADLPAVVNFIKNKQQQKQQAVARKRDALIQDLQKYETVMHLCHQLKQLQLQIDAFDSEFDKNQTLVTLSQQLLETAVSK